MSRSARTLVAAAAAAVLVSACAKEPAASSPSVALPAATYAGAASPTPTHLAGTAVRITVNGAELKQGATAQLEGDAPAVVIITFPMAMDRSSVEPLLPRSASISWTDDRTLSLSIPASENNPAFKVAGSTSADGSSIIDLFFVSLSLPPSFVVSTYSVDELLAGARPPRDSAIRVIALDERRFSPDGRKVLLYQHSGRPTARSPRIFDLTTGSTVILPLPQGANVSLFDGAWASSDQIVLVGEGVWVGAADGSAIRKVADLASLPVPEAVAVSPLGKYAALGWPDRLAIVDLTSGSMRTIAGHHDDCPITNGPGLAWSNDDARFAAVECDAAAPTTRIRIVDSSSGQTVRILDGGDLGVTALLTGDFAVPRESGEQGQGARRLIVVYSFDGTEKSRHLGYLPTLSPDGRYLLDGTCCAGEGFVLVDLKAASQEPRAIQGRAMWLTDGRVLVLQGSAGAR